MPRDTNVPYHQNVYDLLDLEPGVCPVASRMIADHEARFGPLPAAVREWYSVPRMVPLTKSVPPSSNRWDYQDGILSYEYSNSDGCVPLEDVLARFSRISGLLPPDEDDPPGSQVMLRIETMSIADWWIDFVGDEDPPVYSNRHDDDGPVLWNPRGARFSDFTWMWFQFYHSMAFTPVSTRGGDVKAEATALAEKPNETTHWLCTPATPYPVPVIDYLTDALGEPTARTPSFPKPRREGRYATDLFGDPIPARPPTGVTQFSFTAADGLVRLTTDNFDHPTPHAAWWVAGHTPEALDRLRGLLAPWNCFGPVVRTSADAAR